MKAKQIRAAQAVDRLFDWCGMPDVGDPRAYLAAATAILTEYPDAVIAQIADPVSGTKLLPDRPSLWQLRKACDKARESYDREAERELAARRIVRAEPPPPPRTPEEQARIDAQVEAVRKLYGIPPGGLTPRGMRLRLVEGDGKHGSRVVESLARRRAAKAATKASEEGTDG